MEAEDDAVGGLERQVSKLAKELEVQLLDALRLALPLFLSHLISMLPLTCILPPTPIIAVCMCADCPDHTVIWCVEIKCAFGACLKMWTGTMIISTFERQ